MTNQYILAYDFGTSGVKAVLVGYDGSVAAAEECGYALYTPAPGFVEQDPAEYWQAVCTVTHRVMEKASVLPGDVRAMIFSVQAIVLIPVDAEGNPLYRAISWLDGRGGAQAKRLNALLGEELQSDKDYIAKLLWFKENEPDLYRKTFCVTDCNTYLNLKATGTFVDPARPDIFPFHDYFTPRNRETLRLAGLPENIMAPTVHAFSRVGSVCPRAAAELGLTTDTAVFGGCLDTSAAAAGACCLKEGDAHVYFGSSGWLTVLNRGAVAAPCEGIYQFPCIDSDLYIYGGCIQSCCMTFNWAIEQFYHAEKQALGAGIFDLIEREVSQLQPGSDGLLCTPWLYGERSPITDEDTKATFFHITNLHDRRHFIQAVMEGICYCLRWQMEQYTHDTGKTPTRIGAIGGGAQSDHWMQLTADIMQLPVYVPTNMRHAGAIGTAVAAGVGLRLYTFSEAKRIIGMEKEFFPRPRYKARYDKLFGVFQQLYPALKELNAALKN